MVWGRKYCGETSMAVVGGGRRTYEDLTEDGCEARKPERQEPHPEGEDGQGGVVFERDEPECVVLLGLDRALFAGGVEVDRADVLGDLVGIPDMSPRRARQETKGAFEVVGTHVADLVRLRLATDAMHVS